MVSVFDVRVVGLNQFIPKLPSQLSSSWIEVITSVVGGGGGGSGGSAVWCVSSTSPNVSTGLLSTGLTSPAVLRLSCDHRQHTIH